MVNDLSLGKVFNDFFNILTCYAYFKTSKVSQETSIINLEIYFRLYIKTLYLKR